MTVDAAVSLARELAGLAGVPADVGSAEVRGFRVVVDLGPYVAFVAVDAEGARRLRLERQILTTLRLRVPVALPTPLVEHETACLRRKVQGRAGLEHHRVAMSDAAVARSYARELARVMAAFHTAVTPDEVDAWRAAGLPGAPYLDAADIERAAVTLTSPQRDKALTLLERPLAETDRCFLHGDLGSHNLVVDEAGRITGVFDFEEAAIGDRHHDMRWLPSYGPMALAAFAEAYGALAAPVDLSRVRRFHALAALAQLGWGLREPHLHHRTGRTVEQTRAWAIEALAAADVA